MEKGATRRTLKNFILQGALKLARSKDGLVKITRLTKGQNTAWFQAALQNNDQFLVVCQDAGQAAAKYELPLNWLHLQDNYQISRISYNLQQAF